MCLICDTDLQYIGKMAWILDEPLILQCVKNEVEEGT